jgi:lipoate-protein ligase A
MAPNAISHESFSEAIINAFQHVYKTVETDVISVSTQSLPSTFGDLDTSVHAYISRQEKELRAWDWLYGQTPEFTETLSKSFAWGYVVCPNSLA